MKQTARDTSGRWVKASDLLPTPEVHRSYSRWVIVKTSAGDAPFNLTVCRWNCSGSMWETDDDYLVDNNAEWCELNGSRPTTNIMTPDGNQTIRDFYKGPLGEAYRPWDGPRVICLVGRKGVGKTTIAKQLAAKHGWAWDRLAGPIKEMLVVGLGLSSDEVDGHLKEKPSNRLGGKTPRYAMQTLGTEWGRDMIGDTLWTEACIARGLTELAAGKTVIIDDVRRKNEAQLLKEKLGAVLIKVDRDVKRRFSFWDWLFRRGEYHASEREADKIKVDYVIKNNGTVEYAANDIANVVGSWQYMVPNEEM